MSLQAQAKSAATAQEAAQALCVTSEAQLNAERAAHAATRSTLATVESQLATQAADLASVRAAKVELQSDLKRVKLQLERSRDNQQPRETGGKLRKRIASLEVSSVAWHGSACSSGGM